MLGLTGCEAVDPHLSNAVANAMANTSVKAAPNLNTAIQEKPTHALKPTMKIQMDPKTLSLGLDYVVYEDGILDQKSGSEKAEFNINQVNKVWEQCQIHFSIRDYKLVKPSQYGLRSRTSDYQQLQEIRTAFQPTSRAENNLLVVVTDNWNRSGSLGNTWANAWTNLPGEKLLGAVLERQVGDDIAIISHELGHYLSLDHEKDWKNLMSPLIFESSRTLTPNQCASARWAARTYFGVPEP